MKKIAVLSVLVLGLALSVVLTQKQQNVTPKAGTHSGKPTKLIIHQMVGGNVNTPQKIQSNIEFINQNREFVDGVMFNMSGVSSRIMTNNAVSYEEIMSVLAPVRNLNSPTLKYNFALVFNNRPADMFDDWTTSINNWRNLARAARDSGLVGIAFDNENYFASWSSYPGSADYPNRSLQEYSDQTRLRGRQVMEAIVSEYPNIVMLGAFHGPYISEPKTPDKYYNLASYHELYGAFFTGMVEGIGTQATLLDGGEEYVLRSLSDFEGAYQWRKYDLASNQTNAFFIPASTRTIWADRVSISFGLYNHAFRGVSMNAQTMQPTVYNALQVADDAIWVYLEGDDLMRPGGIGEDWVTSIRAAKNQHLANFAGYTPPPATPTPPAGGNYNQADINRDGRVNLLDYVLLFENFGVTGSNSADINNDGRVNLLDFVILFENFGRIS